MDTFSALVAPCEGNSPVNFHMLYAISIPQGMIHFLRESKTRLIKKKIIQFQKLLHVASVLIHNA